jgi:hypothetical protein
MTYLKNSLKNSPKTPKKTASREDARHGFCTNLCRSKFLRAARKWAEREIAEGQLTIEELKVIL